MVKIILILGKFMSHTWIRTVKSIQAVVRLLREPEYIIFYAGNLTEQNPVKYLWISHRHINMFETECTNFLMIT
jgi:hypothetical protein